MPATILFTAERFLGRGDAALFKIDVEFALKNFVDDHFEVAATIALDQWAGAVNELRPTVLNQGAKFEPAAKLMYDFIAFDCFDHV
ncbi:MAG TPA: hypothetical protein VKJ65_13135 [Phycisphaerae bacterium]|nr:hypothetical protein [Phycisphaerae bacterium]